MKKIFEARNSIIEYDGNKVYKTLKNKTVSDDWLNTYNQLRNNNPMYVEVYEVIDEHTYSMEYVEELDTLEYVLKDECYWPNINKNFIIQSIEVFHKAFTDGLQVSKDQGGDYYFLHTDLKLDNLIVDKNLCIKVIDPDSYTWVPQMKWTEKYFMDQINVMFCLQRYFYESSK